jgi:two-component sensor histidine kinase
LETGRLSCCCRCRLEAWRGRTFQGGDDLRSPAGYAFHTGRALIPNHLSDEDRFRTPALLVEHGIARAIDVIIQSDAKRYGLLEVDSPGEGKFDEADISFMESFAAILGVAIQRGEREAPLQEAVALQDVLVQEASHKIKNSLSVVAGLLFMQARTAANEEVAHALRDAGHRLQTVASVHDLLWRNKTGCTVGLGSFIGELCDHLQQSTPGILIRSQVEDVEDLTQQAVTIGLLVNELVTNAIKYAFDEAGGVVGVQILSAEEGRLRLLVVDHGTGLPLDFEAAGKSSLGVNLIASLSRQIGGEPRWERLEPGTRFVVDVLPASDCAVPELR